MMRSWSFGQPLRRREPADDNVGVEQELGCQSKSVRIAHYLPNLRISLDYITYDLNLARPGAF